MRAGFLAFAWLAAASMAGAGARMPPPATTASSVAVSLPAGVSTTIFASVGPSGCVLANTGANPIAVSSTSPASASSPQVVGPGQSYACPASGSVTALYGFSTAGSSALGHTN
jgi:hypothetical protein